MCAVYSYVCTYLRTQSQMLFVYEYELRHFSREGQEDGGPRVNTGYAAPARAATHGRIVFNKIRAVSLARKRWPNTYLRLELARMNPPHVPRAPRRIVGSRRVAASRPGACAPHAPALRAHGERGFCSCPATTRRRPAQHLASLVRSSREPGMRGK